MNIEFKLSKIFRSLSFCVLSLLQVILLNDAYASRIKDIATLKGVRENVLIGYGIVVGLKGTGDSSADVTSQSLGRLFDKLGLDTKASAGMKSKNAAAVIVTAKLPPFARVGNKMDVLVSSIGDASSLEGGTLIVTPLRAGDQNVYAVAQGPVSLGAVADGSTKNFPTVARVAAGATIEKDVETQFYNKKSLRLALNQPDFTTAARLATTIDMEIGGKYATARDSGTIDVIVPFHYEGKTVEFVSILENLSVQVDQKAKIVLNERTGTVVMGEKVGLSPVSIAHGDLTIQVDETNSKDSKGASIQAISGPKVSDLVKSLNMLGVQPKDLTAILQTLKTMGALQAELEIL